ncbi:MAG: sulfotransferase domain-containing protein [Rhodospirillaceae bacterium]
MQRKYVGIYSYPKSGNTWILYTLSHLCLAGDLQASSDVHQGSIDNSKTFKGSGGEVLSIFKSHTPAPIARFSGQIIDHAVTIYIYRHPLDVFTSYLNMLLQEPEKRARFAVDFESVAEVRDGGAMDLFLNSFILHGTLEPGFIAPTSWSNNVLSWKSHCEKHKDTLAIKYEDMLENPIDTLSPILTKLDKTREELQAALTAANESTKKDGKFFWMQKKKNYLEFLTEEQIKRFYEYHGSAAETVGYPLSKALDFKTNVELEELI